MATPHDSFREALALHGSGRIAEAEPLYRATLHDDPHHPGAWHLLGLVHYSRGRYEEALRHIDRAIRLCDT